MEGLKNWSKLRQCSPAGTAWRLGKLDEIGEEGSHQHGPNGLSWIVVYCLLWVPAVPAVPLSLGPNHSLVKNGPARCFVDSDHRSVAFRSRVAEVALQEAFGCRKPQ